MHLLQSFYPQLATIQWFRHCGETSNISSDFCVKFVPNKEIASKFMVSDLWADVNTQAQADLTGYLTIRDYSAYSSHWNNLAVQSRILIEESIKNSLKVALVEFGLSENFYSKILLDIECAALEATYRAKFPKVPVFFSRLLHLYQVGHLPCGWDTDLTLWPRGCILAF